MRKRSAYRPSGINPQAYLVAIRGASVMNAADRVSTLAPAQCAVDTIARGEQVTDHWRALFDVVNTCEELLRAGLAQDWREWHQTVQATLARIVDRQRGGTRALYAEELADLRSLVDTWADLLQVVSLREFLVAQTRVAARTRAALIGCVPGARIVEAA